MILIPENYMADHETEYTVLLIVVGIVFLVLMASACVCVSFGINVIANLCIRRHYSLIDHG